MWRTYYSNGKLLLSGEYTVLDGGLSLAIPTRFGQYLKVREYGSESLKWTSLDENNKIWFQQHFDLNTFQPLNADRSNENSASISGRLRSILISARKLNEAFLVPGTGLEVETHMNFNRNWGLGTSSTLINNIAHWADINPFDLLGDTFGGSGYDIACASHNKPLLYQIKEGRPFMTEIEFDPDFKDHLYFVYLNKKQDSREGIARYKSLQAGKPELINQISGLTAQMVECASLNRFRDLITEHELLMGQALGITPVQKSHFPDYRGAIKSLGAWGGDFVLAASRQEKSEYFVSRGYDTVLAYTQMAL